ncbi:hypothetical protein [Streptomyces acidiscabies]|uniref:hypothetical protein n=1 Tax=Streptomyces acidiscabies TaxID=42234 RepID=UPI0038F7FA85
MTGVRLGPGRAVTGMAIVELLMVSVGSGGLTLEYRSRFEALSLIAAAPWAASQNPSKEQA